MNTGWNIFGQCLIGTRIINLLGNEYWLERGDGCGVILINYKPTGK